MQLKVEGENINFSCLILDLGGVLLDIDYDATKIAFDSLGLLNFSNLYHQFQQNELFDRFECGEISAQRFINELLPHLPSGTSANSVVKAWNAMLGDFDSNKLRFMDQIKQQVPVALLSNTNELHFAEVLRSWKKHREEDMDLFFQKMFISNLIGKRKPNTDTFTWVCSQLQFAPEEVLFIDDSPQHIEGALAAGLQAKLYQPGISFESYFS
jgi:putative hydrolase of the HAD superfamily